MFTLHEATRRGLCRMGFMVLCVLPTCTVLAAAGWLRSDARRVAHEQELSQRLALDVSLERVVLTQPHGVRYEGITLVDPESGVELAKADRFSITQQADAVFISVQAPSLEASRLDDLHALVLRQLRLGKNGERILVMSPQLTLHARGKPASTYEDVSAQFDVTKTDARVVIAFKPEDRSGGDPIQVGLMRNRQTTPATTTVVVDTGKGSALPCSLATPFVPALAKLGAKCKFRGRIVAVDLPGGWTSDECWGELSDVDLASLVAGQFPGELSGMARLTIDAAKFAEGRIEQMHGKLACGDGYIHRHLAEFMTTKFLLNAPQAKRAFGVSHPFSELAFAFAIDAEGLLISGRCDVPQAILVDKFNVAIREPSPAARLPLAVVEEAFSAVRSTLVSVLPAPGDARRR